jgi:hypothetical protein
VRWREMQMTRRARRLSAETAPEKMRREELAYAAGCRPSIAEIRKPVRWQATAKGVSQRSSQDATTKRGRGRQFASREKLVSSLASFACERERSTLHNARKAFCSSC